MSDSTTTQTNALREMRDAAEISADRLAPVLGLTPKTLYNWEHGPVVKAHQIYAYEVAIAKVMEERSKWAGAVTHRFPTLDQPSLFELASAA